jgi:archaellum biogenesis protein FlaJ (TadC family)
MGDIISKAISQFIALLIASVFFVAISASVLALFDWIMGTSYMNPPAIGIGALLAFVAVQMCRPWR